MCRFPHTELAGDFDQNDTLRESREPVDQLCADVGADNFSIYHRGAPRENEAALREALPAWYRSFQP